MHGQLLHQLLAMIYLSYTTNLLYPDCATVLILYCVCTLATVQASFHAHTARVAELLKHPHLST